MRGETISCTRALLETQQLESITSSAVISCEGHRYEIAVREVPMFPSAPCSVVNSVETAVMVNFLAVDGATVRRSLKESTRCVGYEVSWSLMRTIYLGMCSR